MELLAFIYKIILTLGFMAIICNFFYSLYMAVIAIISKKQIDNIQIKNAKMLLIIGVVAVWVAGTIIAFWEKLSYRRLTYYTSAMLLILGCLLFITTLISAVFITLAAWGKHRRNLNSVPIFKNLFGVSFGLAIAVCCSLWAVI